MTSIHLAALHLRSALLDLPLPMLPPPIVEHLEERNLSTKVGKLAPNEVDRVVKAEATTTSLLRNLAQLLEAVGENEVALPSREEEVGNSVEALTLLGRGKPEASRLGRGVDLGTVALVSWRLARVGEEEGMIIATTAGCRATGDAASEVVIVSEPTSPTDSDCSKRVTHSEGSPPGNRAISSKRDASPIPSSPRRWWSYRERDR